MSLYHYDATDVEVIDGDTLEATVHLGFFITKRIRIRIEGIDAPELRGAEKLEGQESKRALEELLAGCHERVRIHSFKGRSFDRWRAKVAAVPDHNHLHFRETPHLRRVIDGADVGLDVGAWMIHNGFARMGAK